MKFSLEIPDLYSEFIKFTVGKVDSHTQIAANIFKSFPIDEWSVIFRLCY